MGTLHFRYLLPENGGFLEVARSLEEHMDQLASVLEDPQRLGSRTERFVDTFIRPPGTGTRATVRFVETLEELGRA
jgi:hypothetical protein